MSAPSVGRKNWYNITWPTATDSEALLHDLWETLSTSRHSSSVMFSIGQFPYLLHWKPTQLHQQKKTVNIKNEQTEPWLLEERFLPHEGLEVMALTA